jgi:hypothetical protein
MSEKGLRPIKSPDRNSTGEHYWMCPKCNNWVGGFVITGMVYDNTRYHEDKFCQKCDTKINWKR